MKWIKVEDEFPAQGRKVIAFYKNSHGKSRMVMAEYIPRFTVLAEDYYACDSEGRTEWQEGDDEHEYVAESWHELIDNWGDYSGCEITEGTVTHWMPIPFQPTEG